MTAYRQEDRNQVQWRQGYVAYTVGIPRDENPYADTGRPIAYTFWDTGWLVAEEDINKECDALFNGLFGPASHLFEIILFSEDPFKNPIPDEIDIPGEQTLGGILAEALKEKEVNTDFVNKSVAAAKDLINNLQGCDWSSEYGSKAAWALNEYRADIARDIFKQFAGRDPNERECELLVEG